MPEQPEALEKEMAKVEREIVDAEAHLDLQLKIVEKMRAQRLSGLQLAEDVLKTLRQSHSLMVGHRELLRRELDNLPRDIRLSEGARVTLAASKRLVG